MINQFGVNVGANAIVATLDVQVILQGNKRSDEGYVKIGAANPIDGRAKICLNNNLLIDDAFQNNTMVNATFINLNPLLGDCARLGLGLTLLPSDGE